MLVQLPVLDNIFFGGRGLDYIPEFLLNLLGSNSCLTLVPERTTCKDLLQLQLNIQQISETQLLCLQTVCASYHSVFHPLHVPDSPRLHYTCPQRQSNQSHHSHRILGLTDKVLNITKHHIFQLIKGTMHTCTCKFVKIILRNVLTKKYFFSPLLNRILYFSE